MHDWEWAKEHHRYVNYYYEVMPSERRKEVVIVHSVLAHEINLGYHQVQGAVVERVNGVDITELRDVLRALETPTRQVPRLRDRLSRLAPRVVLVGLPSLVRHAHRARRREDRAANKDILEAHGVPSDRSADLR